MTTDIIRAMVATILLTGWGLAQDSGKSQPCANHVIEVTAKK